MENYLNYIDKFATETDVQTAVDNGELLKPYVAYIEGEDRIDWNSKKPDYSKKYLTFKITSAGTINVGTGTTYSINGGEWQNTGTTLAVNGGESIRFKGTNGTYNNNIFSGSTAGFNVEGNIMSLIYGDDFKDKTSFPFSSISFLNGFFKNCTGLTSAENLILPVTTLTSNCYSDMFSGCTSLTTAPELPATTLANSCYSGMFRGCTNLTTAPALPATTLSNYCYRNMFEKCTSLVSAPELPATTLTIYCYAYMFYECTGLVNAPSILPATTLASYCYSNMFYKCRSLTKVPSILPATTLINNCYDSMFYGCNRLTTAPELPATTLTNNCYNNMFYECRNLNYIKCLATDISANDCTYLWVYEVASTGTFVKATGVEWPTNTRGIPSGWTVQEV